MLWFKDVIAPEDVLNLDSLSELDIRHQHVPALKRAGDSAFG